MAVVGNVASSMTSYSAWNHKGVSLPSRDKTWECKWRIIGGLPLKFPNSWDLISIFSETYYLWRCFNIMPHGGAKTGDILQFLCKMKTDSFGDVTIHVGTNDCPTNFPTQKMGNKICGIVSLAKCVSTTVTLQSASSHIGIVQNTDDVAGKKVPQQTLWWQLVHNQAQPKRFSTLGGDLRACIWHWWWPTAQSDAGNMQDT